LPPRQIGDTCRPERPIGRSAGVSIGPLLQGREDLATRRARAPERAA
jgi:hypothetical protein